MCQLQVTYHNNGNDLGHYYHWHFLYFSIKILNHNQFFLQFINLHCFRKGLQTAELANSLKI